MAPAEDIFRYRVEQLEKVMKEKADVDELDRAVEKLDQTQQLLQTVLIELATIRTKWGFISAVGALAGGGIVSAIVYLASGSG